MSNKKSRSTSFCCRLQNDGIVQEGGEYIECQVPMAEVWVPVQ